MSLDSTVGDPAVYGWDWSSTTHDPFASAGNVDLRDTVAGLVRVIGGAEPIVVPMEKGLQGWTDCLDVFDRLGYRLGRVYYGGKRNDVHVVSTSAEADAVRDRTAHTYSGKTARVDTRVDSLVPFGDLAAILEESAEAYGSQIVEMTGRAGRRGERHATGRTVYLGAASSAIRVRLYEKWLESPGQYVEGTNRVEVQLRPPSKAKKAVSGWSRAETFCASRVTRSLAERLGADLAPVASLHVNRGTPDLQRTLEVMGQQYGRAVSRWLEASEGDLDTVLYHLLPDEDDD